MNKTKRITLIGIYLTTAIVLYLIEQMIPIPSNIPGVKMGLANIITLIALFTLPFLQVIALVFTRVFITTFLTTGFTAFWFSLAGAMISMLIMAMLIFGFNKIFSIPSISIIGALAHNLSQLIVASYLVRMTGIIYYYPILITSAIFSGFFVGLIAKRLLKFLNQRGYIRYIDELNALMTKRIDLGE